MDVRFSSQQYLKHKSSLNNDLQGSKMSRKLKKNGLAKGQITSKANFEVFISTKNQK